MLEKCLNRRIIRDFLNHYEEKRWSKLIPSLLEIAILNLNSSFHSVFFTEEDINNILSELKSNINSNYELKNEDINTQENKIFSKPSKEWRTADGYIDPNQENNYDNDKTRETESTPRVLSQPLFQSKANLGRNSSDLMIINSNSIQNELNYFNSSCSKNGKLGWVCSTCHNFNYECKLNII